MRHAVRQCTAATSLSWLWKVPEHVLTKWLAQLRFVAPELKANKDIAAWLCRRRALNRGEQAVAMSGATVEHSDIVVHVLQTFRCCGLLGTVASPSSMPHGSSKMTKRPAMSRSMFLSVRSLTPHSFRLCSLRCDALAWP